MNVTLAFLNTRASSWAFFFYVSLRRMNGVNPKTHFFIMRIYLVFLFLLAAWNGASWVLVSYASCVLCGSCVFFLSTATKLTRSSCGCNHGNSSQNVSFIWHIFCWSLTQVNAVIIYHLIKNITNHFSVLFRLLLEVIERDVRQQKSSPRQFPTEKSSQESLNNSLIANWGYLLNTFLKIIIAEYGLWRFFLCSWEADPLESRTSQQHFTVFIPFSTSSPSTSDWIPWKNIQTVESSNLGQTCTRVFCGHVVYTEV